MALEVPSIKIANRKINHFNVLHSGDLVRWHSKHRHPTPIMTSVRRMPV